jgi:predicted TIM-barrel fold metal-dependent hydrolase
MIDDMFVFNAVAHAYDMSDANTRENHYAAAVREGLVAMHRDLQPGLGVDDAHQKTDWPIELLARTLFLESDVDLAATHTLRLDSYFHDGLCSRAKTVEAVRRWPGRFVAYLGVDPTQGLDACLADLDQQIDEIPEAVGLKLYPAQVDPLRSWRMDDPGLALPLFERAQEHGIKTVAVHKAAPLGPVPLNPYRVDDIDIAADAFPGLAFEIVHAGMAFVEETALAIARFPNVYANLEGTTALLNAFPAMFEQVLGTFLFWGGPSKIIYSDGSMVIHSQPFLDSFKDYTFSDAALQRYGIPQLTAEDRASILGGNYARLLGIDPAERLAMIAEDEFSKEKAATGRQAPYSNWKAHLAAVA